MTAPLGRLDEDFDAAVRALEAEAVAATTGPLAAELATVAAGILAAYTALSVLRPPADIVPFDAPPGLDPLAAQQLAATIARALRTVRPDHVHVDLVNYAEIARDLGRDYAAEVLQLDLEDLDLPDPDDADLDELTDTILETAERRAELSLERAAQRALLSAPDDLDDVQIVIGDASRAVDSVRRSTQHVVNASASAGVNDVTAATGTALLWIAERDGCLHCLALSGQVITPPADFPNVTYADRPLSLGPVPYPPRHPHCRCRVRPYDGPPAGRSASTDPASALAREARRSVARGLSGSDSRASRLRAADRLVRQAVDLPATVLARAARDVRRGRFSQRGAGRGLRA